MFSNLLALWTLSLHPLSFLVHFNALFNLKLICPVLGYLGLAYCRTQLPLCSKPNLPWMHIVELNCLFFTIKWQANIFLENVPWVQPSFFWFTVFSYWHFSCTHPCWFAVSCTIDTVLDSPPVLEAWIYHHLWIQSSFFFLICIAIHCSGKTNTDLFSMELQWSREMPEPHYYLGQGLQNS